jgi:hypothetical protein
VTRPDAPHCVDGAVLDLAYVLVRERRLPAAADVVARAARLGLALEERADEDPRLDLLTFGARGLSDFGLTIGLLPVPHPEAARTPVGPTSPSMAEAVAAPAHYLVTVTGHGDTVLARDAWLARASAAVAAASPSVGVLLGHGVVIHEASFFHHVLLETDETRLPLPVCIDVTGTRIDAAGISLQTHGMERYGRENVVVISSPDAVTDAYHLALDVAGTCLEASDPLPAGAVLERADPSEDVVVERVPCPSGADRTVLVVRMP